MIRELEKMLTSTPLEVYKERMKYVENEADLEVVKNLYGVEKDIEYQEDVRAYWLEQMDRVKEGTYHRSIL